MASALASCRDAVTAPPPITPAVHGIRADVGTTFAPSAGFDPNDTYAQVELYVEHSYDVAFDSTIVDPLTGAETTMLHIDAPTDHLLLEGGYDLAGVPRFAVTNLNTPDDASQGLVNVAQMTVGGPNDLTAYGADGITLNATRQIGAPPGDNPLALLGLDATTDILDGVALGGVSLNSAALRTSPALPSGVATSGVVQGAPSTAVTTKDSTATLRSTYADGSTVTRQYRRGPDGIARLHSIEMEAKQRTGTKSTHHPRRII